MRIIERRTPQKRLASPGDHEGLKAAMHQFVIDRIEDDKVIYDDTVSYTHLTLPTIYSV